VSAVSRFAAAFALSLSFAAAACAATAGWPLQQAGTDVSNLASLQRGARNFVNYCLGCHSAKYMRYSQLAEDLALTEEELRASLMFTGTRVYDTMDSAMSAEQGRLWFGNAPPDLSLIARSRGPDYVYTFLRSFYEDASRPTGVNNAVLPGTAMPHVLAPLQGLQQPRFETTAGADGKQVQHLVGLEPGSAPGDLPAAAFDSFVRDTVAFLEYVSEPSKARRQALGVWVILFLLMFTTFAWFLYKEYWKDVK
jgi:ubiquinol-cytochrome c reductase cytochrome c1 subunit